MSQKHVALLTEARRMIEGGVEQFVCIAVKLAAKRLYKVSFRFHTSAYDGVLQEVYEILSLIETSMAPHTTADTWLIFQHDINPTSPEMRAYRLAWIDHMIEYWKDKP